MQDGDKKEKGKKEGDKRRRKGQEGEGQEGGGQKKDKKDEETITSPSLLPVSAFQVFLSLSGALLLSSPILSFRNPDHQSIVRFAETKIVTLIHHSHHLNRFLFLLLYLGSILWGLG